VKPLPCVQTHGKELTHRKDFTVCVCGGDTRQRFFTVVVVSVCGPPCVNTQQKVRVPNHFYHVFLPHGKELVSGSEGASNSISVE
jgi:hypothetical protein